MLENGIEIEYILIFGQVLDSEKSVLGIGGERLWNSPLHMAIHATDFTPIKSSNNLFRGFRF